jgi:imidazolonepropionase-like amidohydrolase
MRKIAGLGAILPTLTLSIALHQASPAQTTPTAPETTYVKAGHLFDSESGTYRQNVTLVLSGDRIKSIESGTFAIPSGAKVTDLSNDYVLPGLIDCHTHLGARADKYDPINSFKDTPSPTPTPA